MSSRPPNAPTGKPAADHLPEGREVRGDANQSLRAGDAKSKGHDLVEDEQHAQLARQLAQRDQKARLGGDHPAHRDWFDDYRGDIAAMGSQNVFSRLYVVERRDERVRHDVWRESAAGDGTGRPCRGICAGIDADGHGIVAAMIAPLELEDF